jgi:hypothetical protein
MTVAAWIRGLPVGVVQAIKGAFDYPSSQALVATGNSQATALPLPRDFNVFNTVSASTGAILPWGADQQPTGSAAGQTGLVEIGDTITVVNNQAAQALLVYPQLAGTVQGAGANAGFSIAANKQAVFSYIGLGKWVANLSA